jgi:signal recognition particle receptor subunit beta
MVFFNYATMQMAAKIVYYGPGLCGKTTNLHFIYGRTAPGSRGEMVSLETETDRTLFFDLLPLDVGVISGFKTRLQLYTVPGQVFYNTTRKLVLKGVDGIVFVADSQRPMAEPNRESLKNLRENLAEIGIGLDTLPRVFQYNKRDLGNILSVDELNAALNQDRSIEWYEASATNGPGVFETLKAISKLTLRSLKSKMSADMRRPAVAVSPSTPSAVPVAVAADVSGISAAVTALDPAGGRGRGSFDSTLTRLQKFRELQARQAAADAGPGPGAAEVAAPPFAEAANPLPVGAVGEDTASEVRFAELKASEPAPASEPPVKHVRVRSSVDILSELEKLRKLSTQKPAPDSGGRPRSGSSLSIDDLLSGTLSNHRKDVAHSFEWSVPKEALGKSRKATITVTFQDGSGGETTSGQTFNFDLANLRDVQRLLLALKFNVHGS